MDTTAASRAVATEVPPMVVVDLMEPVEAADIGNSIPAH